MGWLVAGISFHSASRITFTPNRHQQILQKTARGDDARLSSPSLSLGTPYLPRLVQQCLVAKEVGASVMPWNKGSRPSNSLIQTSCEMNGIAWTLRGQMSSRSLPNLHLLDSLRIQRRPNVDEPRPSGN